MPRYFFDIDDGTRQTRDDTGFDLPDLQTARDEALAVLPSLARDEIPDGDEHVLTVHVRDAEGQPIFRASLSLSSQWFVPH